MLKITFSVGITGAGGYVGTYLLKSLINEERVRAIKAFVRRPIELFNSSPKVQFIQGDIRDSQKQDEFLENIDIVIHAASKLGHGPWHEFNDVNVQATERLFSRCSVYNVRRFIYISSIEVYGFFKEPKYQEGGDINPCNHFYSDSKILAEQAIHSVGETGPTEWIIIRPGMVFGHGSVFWTERLFKQALRQSLPLVNNGRGYIYPINIYDLIKAIHSTSFSKDITKEIFNVCMPEEVKWQDLYHYLGRRLNKDVTYFLPASFLYLQSLNNSWNCGYRSKTYNIYNRYSKLSSEKICTDLSFDYENNFEKTMDQGTQWVYEKK